MSTREAFPLYFPGDVRRAFGSDEVTRRVARIAAWTKGSRVLELGCGGGSASVVLARDFGCEVVAADVDDALLATARDRVRAAGLVERIDLRKVDFGALSVGKTDFDGILLQGRVPYRLEDAVQRLRALLAPSGRLALTYPVKVSRHPAKSCLDLWERRLGEPLRLPREVLQVFERHGYEPQSVETANDTELDEVYRAAEAGLKSAPSEQAETLREELELHQSQGSKASVSFALAIGRRREPGERPPATRDRG